MRRTHPCLRQSRFLHDREHAGNDIPDVAWQGLEGGAVNWGDPHLAGFCLLLGGCADATNAERRDPGDRMALIFNRSPRKASIDLPPPGSDRVWLRTLETDRFEALPSACFDLQQDIPPESVVVFEAGAIP